MNIRITQLTLVLALVFSVTTLYAQNGGGGGKGSGQGRGGGGGGQGGEGGQMMDDPKAFLEDRMAELERELGLSGAQAVAIQALHQDFFDQLEVARSSGDRSQMESMRKLRDQTDKEVITLLTDEQADQYKVIRKKEIEEMQARMETRHGGRGGHIPPG